MFAIMLATSGVFAVSSWNVPVSKRIFYVTTTLTAIIASLSYFALASGQAISYNCIAVRDAHEHVPDTFHEVCRQVYWARYVDWALTTPLLLLNLCLLAGVDGAHTLMAISANVIMILSGLFSAFGTTGTAQKWGWYTIACVSYLFVIWHVALHGARMSDAKGVRVSKLFTWMAVFTFALWTVYPVYVHFPSPHECILLTCFQYLGRCRRRSQDQRRQGDHDLCHPGCSRQARLWRLVHHQPPCHG